LVDDINTYKVDDDANSLRVPSIGDIGVSGVGPVHNKRIDQVITGSEKSSKEAMLMIRLPKEPRDGHRPIKATM
jgi:hypothetical protein